MVTEIKSEGCDLCGEAKKGFILLDKIGFKNIGVMCLNCDTIWKLGDSDGK